jgi:hypothetical protein
VPSRTMSVANQRRAMRLKPVRAPYALNGTYVVADGLANHRAGPMRRFGRLDLERQGNDPLGHVLAQRRDPGGACLVAKKAVEAFPHDGFLPDAGLGFAGREHQVVRTDAIGVKPHDLGPPSVLLRDVAVSENRLEPLSIGGGYSDGNSRSKVATPEQSDLRTALGEFRKALRLGSPAVLLIGLVFAGALKARNWNLLTKAARQAVSLANWKDLPDRRIEP